MQPGNRNDLAEKQTYPPGACIVSMSQHLAVSQSSLTADEATTLERVQTVTRLLDEAVRIPGTEVRIGLDPILSILPVAGDAAGAVLSLYPILEAYRLGVPNRTLLVMLSLVAVDAVIGSVPILGTVFDALWTANQWNYRLMERELDS